MVGGLGGLAGLVYAGRGRSRRVSSWDTSGGNQDFVVIEPGGTAVLAELQGAGRITHLWMTVNTAEPHYLRRMLLRAFWDGEERPSVESPLGDFFGVGHGRVSPFVSLPLSMVTGGEALTANRAAMNCYFAMPFARGARLEVVNQSEHPVSHFYYHVDYQEGRLEPETLRFHARWHREAPTAATVDLSDPAMGSERVFALPNRDGADNYVILEAEGRGHYVGCVLSVDHTNPMRRFGWFGEGDEMIFIDGEGFPPSIHGTGTEDYFCAAWGYPGGAYAGPYHGVTLAGPTAGALAYSGKWSMYRFHVEDPVRFERSIRVTIEHGHANCHASDYSSTAYWYQTEPHRPFEPMPPAEERLPLPDEESLRLFLRTIG